MHYYMLIIVGLLVSCRAPLAPPLDEPAVALAITSSGATAGRSATRTAPPPLPQTAPARVVAVVDGDTLLVQHADRRVTVDLLGVDAPDLARAAGVDECYGSEAASLLRRLVDGRLIQVVPDISPTDADTPLMRDVYVVNEAGQKTAVNQELVWRGYARAQRLPEDQHQDLLHAEQAARESSRGLWASTTCNGARMAVLPG